MDKAEWIAVDWGTSTLRLWAMQGDRVLAERRGDEGMGRLDPGQYEATLLRHAADWLTPGRETEVLVCGMAGARTGWHEAPYRPVPCTPAGPGAVRVATADPRLSVRILPGLSQARPADVMRGEETQIAGFLASRPRFDGVLCLPGTHTKWVQISAGEVVSFRTFMTGELFALLSTQSVLRLSVAPGGNDAAVFRQALADAISRPESLASALFSLRAAHLLDGQDPVAARARLSGLLIGLELAGARPWWLGAQVVLIGAAGVTDPYRAALAEQGLTAEVISGESMVLAGLCAARTGEPA